MILPGDIIAVRGVGWLADGIVKAEYGKIPPANAVSHVGIVTTSDFYDVQVTEALTRVETHDIQVTLAACQSAWIVQHLHLTTAQRLKIVNAALSFSGRDYGYFDLLLQGTDALTGSTWWTDNLAWWLKRWPICSYVAAAAYDTVGVLFGPQTTSVKPSDIMITAEKSTDYAISKIK